MGYASVYGILFFLNRGKHFITIDFVEGIVNQKFKVTEEIKSKIESQIEKEEIVLNPQRTPHKPSSRTKPRDGEFKYTAEELAKRNILRINIDPESFNLDMLGGLRSSECRLVEQFVGELQSATPRLDLTQYWRQDEIDYIQSDQFDKLLQSLSNKTELIWGQEVHSLFNMPFKRKIPFFLDYNGYIRVINC